MNSALIMFIYRFIDSTRFIVQHNTSHPHSHQLTHAGTRNNNVIPVINHVLTTIWTDEISNLLEKKNTAYKL